MQDGKELADRADRKTTAERMRHGERAPTLERARVEADIARGILRMWWAPWAYLCIAVVSVLLLMSQDDVVGRVLGLSALLGQLGIAAWSELHRRGAARLLDANQRHWGDVQATPCPPGSMCRSLPGLQSREPSSISGARSYRSGRWT
jgi:hypothetical protein